VVRHRAAGTFLGCALIAALACSGCSSTTSQPAAGPPGTSGTATATARSAAVPASPSPSRTPLSCPARVFAQMTAAQRVGQLFLVDLASQPASAVAQAVAAYHFGSLLFGTTTSASLTGIKAMTAADQALATRAATARVRFFIATDQEGGEVQRLRGAGFSAIPSAVAQGQLSAATLQRDAARWGRQLKLAGVNLDLAPVTDVVPPGTASRNQPIGMLLRNFGTTPAAVAAHGAAFIRGMRLAGVAATAKHFPGLGRVAGNTDLTAEVTDPVTTPDDPYLQPFRAAIGAGVPFVMVSLASYPRIDPGHLAVFSARVMRLLRTQLRFGGVIISDDMGAAKAVASVPPATRALDFLAVGGDMITSVSLPVAAAMDAAVLSRVHRDAAFRAKADAAVMRVLTAKQAYGLLSCPAG
jgi:beta-N-acetylhexosaminidase